MAALGELIMVIREDDADWDKEYICHMCDHFGDDDYCECNDCKELVNRDNAVKTLFWKRDGTKNI